MKKNIRNLATAVALLAVFCGGRSEKTEYYPEGMVRCVYQVRGGAIDGTYIKLSKKGDTLSVETYRKAVRNGLCRYFSKDFTRICTYKKGVLQGTTTVLRPDGTKVFVMNCKNGRLSGVCTMLDITEKPVLTCEFRDGRPWNGVWGDTASFFYLYTVFGPKPIFKYTEGKRAVIDTLK